MKDESTLFVDKVSDVALETAAKIAEAVATRERAMGHFLRAATADEIANTIRTFKT